MTRDRILAVESGLPQETMTDGFYTVQTRKALTNALGVYELTDGYRTDTVLYLPSHLSRLCLSPGRSRLCVICAWDLTVFDTETGEETDTILISNTAETDVFLQMKIHSYIPDQTLSLHIIFY